jgi:broad specificity phosphatase PhoE
MIIYLVRHGESLSRDALSHAVGETTGLSSTGKKQAKVLGKALARAGIAAIFSSTMQRARETAAIIQSCIHAPLLLDPRLNEHMVSRGETDRGLIKELRQRVRRDKEFAPYGGESFMQAVGRFRLALLDIASGHIGRVVVVTHREIIQNFLLKEFSLPMAPPVHEASWSVVEYLNGSFRIISLNNAPFSYVFLWHGFRRRLKTLLAKSRYIYR